MAPPAVLTYLDHAATTPVRSEVVEAMMPFYGERFANPSGSHRAARDARRAVDEARESVADAVGCDPGDVVFTSGGTEGDNAAILGAAGRGRVVCSQAEHHAVLEAVHRAGGEAVAVGPDGAVDLDGLDAALDDTVGAVSLMAVNNEVGTITDLAAVARVVRRRSPSALLHTDAVQAACWIDLRSIWQHVDAMSLSAHKFGGPKGVGALVVRSGHALSPLLVGGGQERDRRSGTHNVPGIVGMSTALRLADGEREGELPRLGALRDRLVDGIVAGVESEFPGVDTGIVETVPRDRKVAGSAHLCVDGAESEALLYLLDEAGVCASAASACASGAMEPSHVLASMGVPLRLARGAVRLTLGRTTTPDDIDRATAAMVAAVCRVRRAGMPR
ncbi:MAG: cysteine desulfurase family protein [Ilumatobacteraceae bacterium]